ncbi:MFS transporter, partial [Escherichia coli]
TGGTADRNRSHWSTSKTPSYTKSVSWQHHPIGGSIPAFILGLSGYIANQAQTTEVIMGIRTSIALVPCGFMLLAFVIIWFYPLTDKKFKEIVVEIDNRKKMQQQLISDIIN